jgi:hypothetical protein
VYYNEARKLENPRRSSRGAAMGLSPRLAEPKGRNERLLYQSGCFFVDCCAAPFGSSDIEMQQGGHLCRVNGLRLFQGRTGRFLLVSASSCFLVLLLVLENLFCHVDASASRGRWKLTSGMLRSTQVGKTLLCNETRPPTLCGQTS